MVFGITKMWFLTYDTYLAITDAQPVEFPRFLIRY